MNADFIVGLGTWGFYAMFEKDTYRASWRVYAFCILFTILILKFIPDLDWRARLFIVMILSWHVVDIMTHAIDDGLKNDEDHKCTFTASISIDEKTEENGPEPSSPVKDSTLNSSEPPMEKSKPPRTSISPLENTDAP